MSDLINEVAATSTEAVPFVQYVPTKDPFDERFDPNVDTDVAIDEEKYLYKGSEWKRFAGKVVTTVSLASLRMEKAFDYMKNAINSRSLEDCNKVHEELGKILYPANRPIDFEFLKSNLIEAKTKPEILEVPAKFRLSETQIKMLQDYHLQTSKNASTIYDELGKLPNGKDVLPITTIDKWIKKVSNKATSKAKTADLIIPES